MRLTTSTMSNAGSDTSKEGSSSESSSDSSNQNGDNSSTGYGNQMQDSGEDADDEQSSSDNNETPSDNSDYYSACESPEPDETEGEIVQCEECHCWTREGQSHTCEPEEKDKYAKA
ncbi:hypothetical protein Daesc_009665 [Daldinia eschscholtzii]|uniref:Uncharacterized protein n=1 Tax=Daldinia eschscholtzii TaxID=292717 RepID=A0AAX6MBK6_9PEZI